MNLFAIASIVLLLSVPFASAQEEPEVEVVDGADPVNATEEMDEDLPAPENLIGDSAANAVAAFWSPVEGATQYFVSLSNSNRTEIVAENRIAFGGLEPNTEYIITIAAVNADEEISPLSSSINITTLLPRVQNLRFVDATETAIEITWETRSGTTGYNILVTDANEATVEANVTIEETTAVIAGLRPRTFYTISVMAMSAQGPADSDVVRARTDGQGVDVIAVWENTQGIIGGEAAIFRPINIPVGTYTIVLNFECNLNSARVWNADLDNTATNFTAGEVVIRQSEVWQRTKPEIGLVFYFRDSAACDARRVSAQFGNEAIADPVGSVNDTVATNIPVAINEWRNTTLLTVQTAGLVAIRLMDVYNDTGDYKPTHPKPSLYDFVIAVNGGPLCPRGVNIRYAWSMTQKATRDIDIAEEGTAYFVQNESDWFSNEAGFVYGYNPSRCRNRNGLTARVLEGGPIVQAVLSARDIDPVY